MSLKIAQIERAEMIAENDAANHLTPDPEKAIEVVRTRHQNRTDELEDTDEELRGRYWLYYGLKRDYPELTADEARRLTRD